MAWTLGSIAELVGGRLAGRPEIPIERVAPLHTAGPRDLTLVAAPNLLPKLAESKAAAAIVPEGVEVPGRDVVHHANPHLALAKALAQMYPSERLEPGVHVSAYVDESAKIGEGVRVGPHAIVQRDAELGDGVRVAAGAYVGRGVKVGARTVLYPHVVLYERVTVGRDCIVHAGAVIGADGFGFTRHAGRNVKIPQVGGVVIGDDVEIGASTCIDAGTMEPTRIGTNTKIDNLVQVGHNVRVGERAILCGGVSIAGSATIGDDATLAGQAGVAGHVTVGAGSTVAAGAGVISDVEPRSVVAGMPHLPHEEWKRAYAALRRLPDLQHEVRELRKRLEELERAARRLG